MITRLSRAKRSLRHLLELAARLSGRKVHLQVLKQGTGTSTLQGRLVFRVPSALDEFQRELIVEGTYEGLGSAQAPGCTAGDLRDMPAGQVRLARDLASQRATGGPRVHHLAAAARHLSMASDAVAGFPGTLMCSRMTVPLTGSVRVSARSQA